jgi:hypothetical protein
MKQTINFSKLAVAYSNLDAMFITEHQTRHNQTK